MSWDGLHAPLDPGRPPAGACCLTCRGPVQAGYARCYQCDRHLLAAPGLLADVVVPISYAIRGSGFAADLWHYKATGDAGAGARLLALLLAFLRDHAGCVCRAARMPTLTHYAMVPSGYGRPGVHPLHAMLGENLRRPLAGLSIRPGHQARDLDTDRFMAKAHVGPGVLVIDDTWVSGASAQSAAAAVRQAGATRVAVVVLGRYLNALDPAHAAFAARAASQAYDPARCAVHACGAPG